jgi:hypothetical protein
MLLFCYDGGIKRKEQKLMKKLITFAALCGTLLVTGGGVLAAGQANQDYAGVELVTADSGLKSDFISDQPRPRYEDGEVDGGWWTRGQIGNSLVSEYKHYTASGYASCRNGNGSFDDGGWKPAGEWSKSRVGYTLLGGNRVYYNHE